MCTVAADPHSYRACRSHLLPFTRGRRSSPGHQRPLPAHAGLQMPPICRSVLPRPRRTAQLPPPAPPPSSASSRRPAQTAPPPEDRDSAGHLGSRLIPINFISAQARRSGASRDSNRCASVRIFKYVFSLTTAGTLIGLRILVTYPTITGKLAQMSHALLASETRAPTPQALTYQEDLLPEMQEVLAALANLEVRIEIERECLDNWSGRETLKAHLLAELEQEYRAKREPFVVRLTELKQQIAAFPLSGVNRVVP